MAPLTVALLGLGEAGSALAGDLVAAGASVRGFDPAAREVAGIDRAADAARGGRRQRRRARASRRPPPRSRRPASASGGLRRGPGLRRPQHVGRRAQARGRRRSSRPPARSSPTSRSWRRCPRDGLRTPALVVRPGARAPSRERLRPLGMPVEVLGERARRRGRRASCCAACFMKGLAAALPREPARRARGRLRGLDARGDRGACSTAADAALLERLVDGQRAPRDAPRSARSATRRELLRELGVEPRVTEAAGGWLAQLASEGSGWLPPTS